MENAKSMQINSRELLARCIIAIDNARHLNINQVSDRYLATDEILQKIDSEIDRESLEDLEEALLLMAVAMKYREELTTNKLEEIEDRVAKLHEFCQYL
jgi:hypothetical protein